MSVLESFRYYMNDAHAFKRLFCELFPQFIKHRRDGECEHLVQPEGMENDLMAFYNEEIGPAVRHYGQKRLEMLNELAKRKAIAFASVLGAFLFGLILNAITGFSFGAFIFLVLVPLGIGVTIWSRWPRVTLRRDIKEKLFPRILRYFGEDFQFVPEGGIAMERLEASQILPKYNYASQEDYVCGSHKGVSIEVAELSLERREKKRDSEGKTQTESYNVFRGLVVLLGAHKHFNGQTIVVRDGGKLGNFFKKQFSALENVKLEDPIFENAFEVYGTDQVEARYLLTPSFMERLLHLEDMFSENGHGKRKKPFRFENGGIMLDAPMQQSANRGIQAAFYQNQLLLMIPSRLQHFEVGSLEEQLTFYEEVNRVVAEMADIFAMIETLKLHERTGL